MTARYEVIEDEVYDRYDFESGEFEPAVSFRAGEVVYEFTGCTYGCIDRASGIACSRVENVHPFFEVRRSNLRPLTIKEFAS